MYDFIAEIDTGSVHQLNFLFLLGIAVIGGTIGAKLFQRLRIPQVVGYIVIGLLIGESGARVVTVSAVDAFEPLNYFALGIIGFLIGGELKFDLFKQYGKQFTAILIAEGIGAFIIVGIAASVLAYLFTKDFRLSVALGVVLGAISSATDPASTVQVLWEYKTRGPLTTATIAVVALDDVLALTLYAIGTSLAGVLTGQADTSMAIAVAKASEQIFISLAVGALAGFILNLILRRIQDRDTALTFTIGAVLLVLGLSIWRRTSNL